jgi:hypothetical protein
LIEQASWLSRGLDGLHLDGQEAPSHYACLADLDIEIQKVNLLVQDIQRVHGPALMAHHRDGFLLFQHVKAWLLQCRSAQSEHSSMFMEPSVILAFLLRWKAALHQYSRSFKYIE